MTPSGATRTSPALIGRDAVLRSLRDCQARARDGQRGIAVITGEGGIGKSRLVAELCAHIRDDPTAPAAIVQGNCFEPDRSLPYAPLLDLLDAFIRTRPPGEIADAFGTAAADLLPLAPALAQAIPGLAPAAPLDPDQEKRRLFQGLARFFLRLAGSTPVVVVIEDIHWCDDTSLDFFVYLARRIATARLLLVFTLRGDEIHPAFAHFLAMLERERLATEYPLPRLTPPEAEAMLRAIFGDAARVRGEFAATVFALTDGNPFFIEEVVTSAEVARRGEPPVAVAALPDAVRIPRSVHDAVRRRSVQLGDEARALLRTAAAAGRRFDFALLQALTAQDEPSLLRGIKELVDAHLVVEESADRFAFRHALTQRAVYSDLLTRERRLLHRTIAEAIERVYAGTLDPHLADLAHHFYAAGAWEPALVYSRRVGERALALHAPRAAVDHFTRAIGAAQQLDASLPADLYRARGLAYGILGEFERARADHAMALGVAQETGDRQAEWRSLTDLGDLWAGRDYALAGAYFRQAADLGRGLDDPAIYARSLNRLANWLINTGQPAESLRVHDEALGIFTRTNDRPGMAETLDLLGMANGIAGATIDGVRHYTRAIALLRDGAEGHLLSSSLASRALYASPSLSDVTYGAGGDPDEAARDFAEALRLARGASWLAGEAYAHWTAAAAAASYGDLGPALSHGEDALRVAGDIEHQQWTAAAHWALGQAHNALLAPEEAIAHLDAGLALAGALGSAWWLAHLSASLAHAHLLRNDPVRAAAALAAVLPADGQPRIMPERRIAWMWGEIALARRDPAGALLRADTLIASTPGTPSGEAIPWLAKLRGEALTALARLDESEIALDAAAAAAARQHALPLLWQVDRARGRLYRRWKRDADAVRAFTQARSQVGALAATLNDAALGARFLAAALATMPREQPRSAREIDSERYGGLTPRERDVAAQIALGKPNRAVAEALFLSERTVTTHVTSILAKLHLTSRAQIATWAREVGLPGADA